MKKRFLASESAEKAYENDYHGHPKYKNIYILLVVLLAATLIPNIINLIAGKTMISVVWWVVIFIFVFSTWKAILVLRNFMHVKFEPALVFGLVGVGLLCLFILFWLVKADIPSIDPNTKMNLRSYKKAGKIYIYDELANKEKVFDINEVKKALYKKK